MKAKLKRRIMWILFFTASLWLITVVLLVLATIQQRSLRDGSGELLVYDPNDVMVINQIESSTTQNMQTYGTSTIQKSTSSTAISTTEVTEKVTTQAEVTSTMAIGTSAQIIASTESKTSNFQSQTSSSLQNSLATLPSESAVTSKLTSAVTTASTVATTKATTTSISTGNIAPGITTKALPQKIMQVVESEKKKYPNIVIGVGLFSLDGKNGYVYNENKLISSACTVKAAFACFVLEECEAQGISIWSEKLTYTKADKNTGSGVIKNDPIGSEYSIAEILRVLLYHSDNTGYNILVRRFSPETATTKRLEKFNNWLAKIGGANLAYQTSDGSVAYLQYGSATVMQRYHEWLYIWNYINSSAKYAKSLETYLKNTLYCYITMWMSGKHTYLHKSGWSDGNYTSAADCAIVDGQYLLVVITQDYTIKKGHADTVKNIGKATEAYISSIGGANNLFK